MILCPPELPLRKESGEGRGPVVSHSNSSPQNPCPPKGEPGTQAVWEQKETHSDSFHPQPPSASLAVPFTPVTLISLDPKEGAPQVTCRSIPPLPCVICQNIGIFPVRRTHLTLPRSPMHTLDSFLPKETRHLRNTWI